MLISTWNVTWTKHSNEKAEIATLDGNTRPKYMLSTGNLNIKTQIGKNKGYMCYKRNLKKYVHCKQWSQHPHG